MFFNCASTFRVDSNSVEGASLVSVSRIDLFIKSKPEIAISVGGNGIATGDVSIPTNPSGLAYPGMTLYIVPTLNGTPILDPSNIPLGAYCDYFSIQSSSDASIPTTFRFKTPVPISTDMFYAVVIAFDQGAPFILWTNVEGEWLVGTTTVSTGAAGQFNGEYFEYLSLSTGSPASAYKPTDPETLVDLWQPINGTELKISIFASRYKYQGVDVQNYDFPTTTEIVNLGPYGTDATYANSQFTIPALSLEYMTYDQTSSTQELFVGGQMVYQNTFCYPGGYAGGSSAVSISTYSNTIVVANTSLPNGQSFSWMNVFPSQTSDMWIVLNNGDGYVDVRQIAAIIDAQTILLSTNCSFSNSSAQFMITPTGFLSALDKSSPFGYSTSILTVTDSSANSSVRFVNNVIETLGPVSGGNGYSNSDILFVQGYEYVAGKVIGGYPAIANLVTNSTGGIIATYLSNSGCGFVSANAVTYVVANSTSGNITSNTSAGSGATFSRYVGGTIKTEMRANNNFRGISVVNLPVSSVIPFFEVSAQPGSDYNMELVTTYEQTSDNTTSSGFAYYVNPILTGNLTSNNAYTITPLAGNPLLLPNATPAFISYSNEFVTLYSNGAPNDQISNGTSFGLEMVLDVQSNNDYTTVFINTAPKAIFSKYIINDFYTGEETDQGDAWARGLTTQINFGRTSEDIIVYLDAWKPYASDIKVYARIFNNFDSDTFGDKDWTLLEAQNSIYSSSTDPTNLVELQYGFPQHPNTSGPISGSMTAANGSANVVGLGTTFTAIANNTLVRIYPTLFPNTNMIAVVNNVVNNTFLTLQSPLANVEFYGQNLSIEPVEFPHQAFNNILNQNVVRYFSSSMTPYDGYDAIAVKIVMLTTQPTMVPHIKDLRILGLSA